MQNAGPYLAVLLAAMAHAAWNTMVKGSKDQLLMLTAIRFVGLAAGLVTISFVPAPAAASLPYLAGAAAFHYAYYAMMLQAYRVGDMSQVYPIARGTAPLVVTLLAATLAGEWPGAPGLLAVGLLCAGIALLAGSKAPQGKAVLFAMLTGLAISGYSFLSGLGIRQSGSLLGYIAWLEIATGLGMSIVALKRRRHVLQDFISRQWRLGLIAGCLSVGGYAIALWAMSLLPMAPVVALRETSVVFAALLGSLFLGEGETGKRSSAAILITLGIALLVSGQ